MVSKNLCALLLWIKVASALEGLRKMTSCFVHMGNVLTDWIAEHVHVIEMDSCSKHCDLQIKLYCQDYEF